MRKIIFINRFFYPDHSATSQILAELAFDLAAKVEGIRVVTSRQRYDFPEARLKDQEEIQGVRIYRIWTTHFGRHFLLGRAMDYVTFYLSVLPVLLRMVKNGDIVVAMTDPPLISLFAAWVARLKGAILINWVHDLFPEVAKVLGVRGMNGYFAEKLRQWRNHSLGFAHANVVLGTGMAEKLDAEGIPANKIRMIHNWSDSNQIRPIDPKENPLRQQWGLVDRFVVGYSGNMGRAHEFETVLAAAKLLQKQTNIMFLFIGGGAKQQSVIDGAERLGLENIQFQPYQPKEALSISLSVADLHWISLLPMMEGLIVPSKFYGIAAVGRPILFVGDLKGEIAGLLNRFQCGFSVTPGEVAPLAQRVMQLAGDPQLCQEMGREARRMLENHFDRPLAVQAWARLLQEMY